MRKAWQTWQKHVMNWHSCSVGWMRDSLSKDQVHIGTDPTVARVEATEERVHGAEVGMAERCWQMGSLEREVGKAKLSLPTSNFKVKWCLVVG